MTIIDPQRRPAMPCEGEAEFRRDVLAGLNAPRKAIPSKYLYDTRGSQLFDQICETEEYYPTRTELAITEAYAGEIAERLGPNVLLIELGSGSSIKTRILLMALDDPAGYVPVDIAGDHLAKAAAAVDAEFPDLAVLPVCGDFLQTITVPELPRSPARRVVYFPGSTIGNLTESQATRCLRQIADLVRPDGALIIGIDLEKDADTLEAAYNDAAGVTAAFSLNLLQRMNRELGADFDTSRFRHRAVYDEDQSRVKIELVSLCRQRVRVDGTFVDFDAGEGIHTEYSQKYSLEGFAELAAHTGLHVDEVWMDDDRLFSVQYLVVRNRASTVT